MRVVALAGGVGGSKLAHGLTLGVPPPQLTVVVNTADDFRHLGLHISPDLDTVCYMLAGLSNEETGWGRADETWHVLDSLEQLGEATWFQLGDKDLATHLARTRMLSAGMTLTSVTAALCDRWHIASRILPMTDDRVATVVDTEELGALEFQDYFVRHGCKPRVRGFRFSGIESARPAPGVLEAITESDWVVICPSNPWVSIGPILSLPGVRDAISGKRVMAVSPIIQGASVRGPAAKMYAEMGLTPSALSVAKHYVGIASDFVVDQMDLEFEPAIRDLGMRALAANTLMQTAADRRSLAQTMLDSMSVVL